MRRTLVVEAREDQIDATGDTPSSSRGCQLEDTLVHVVVATKDEEGDLA